MLLTSWADFAATVDIDIGQSNDTELGERIYDILVEIIDPCHVYSDSFSVVNDFEVRVDSIVTHTPSIYYQHEAITNQISDVLKLDNIDFFYNLVESILNFNNNNDNFGNNDLNDLLSNLFLSSLYINRLFSLSISIPSEKYRLIDNFYNFDIFSIRVNNETINEKLSNITILIDNSDTNIGRNEFSNYDESFDCVDVIIIVLSNNQEYNNVESVLYNSTSNMTSSRALIKILSNQSRDDENNRYDLQQNVVIVFDDASYNQDTSSSDDTNTNTNEYHCVWLDETNDIWDDGGCMTDIIDNTVVCQCSHLTSFAVIWHIDEGDEVSSVDESEEESDDVWDVYTQDFTYTIILLGYVIGFFSVAVFVVCLFYRMHKNNISMCDKTKPYETAYGALLFTLFQSIVEINACLVFYMFVAHLQHSDSFVDSGVIVEFYEEFVTFSLLLPLIVSFYIFSHVIYGMAIVAVSISPRLAKKKKKIQKYAIIGNVIVTVLFLFIVASLIFDLNSILLDQIFFISEMIYILFLVVTVILIVIYGIDAIRIVYTSIKTIENQNKYKLSRKISASTASTASRASKQNSSKNKQDSEIKIQSKSQRRAMLRIVIAAVFSCLFVVIQILTTMYFMIYPNHFHAAFQLVDIGFNLLFLIVIIYLYHHYVETKISQKIEQSYVPSFDNCNYKFKHTNKNKNKNQTIELI